MRIFGIILMILSFVVGSCSSSLPKDCDARPFVGIAFLYFILGIAFLMIAKKNDNDDENNFPYYR